jgi:hypothetical protein
MEDPNNVELAAQRQTMFMGGAPARDAAQRVGLGTLGAVVTIAGIVVILPGVVLLAMPLPAGWSAQPRHYSYRLNLTSSG